MITVSGAGYNSLQVPNCRTKDRQVPAIEPVKRKWKLCAGASVRSASIPEFRVRETPADGACPVNCGFDGAPRFDACTEEVAGVVAPFPGRLRRRDRAWEEALPFPGQEVLA